MGESKLKDLKQDSKGSHTHATNVSFLWLVCTADRLKNIRGIISHGISADIWGDLVTSVKSRNLRGCVAQLINEEVGNCVALMIYAEAGWDFVTCHINVEAWYFACQFVSFSLPANRVNKLY